MSAVARHLIISGRVQGVSFRAFVKSQADKLGVDGFVRNRKDGTVEAVVAGRAEQVEALIALCHKGPSAAQVTDVKISETSAPADKGFHQLPTV